MHVLGHAGERAQQSLVVLVRPEVRRIEDEALGQRRQRGVVLVGRRREAVVVDGAGDRGDARGVDAQPRDDLAAGVVGQRQDVVRVLRGAVVGDAPERPLAAREELRQLVVLDVVERDDARRARDPRDRDRHRVVDEVDPRRDVAGEHPRREQGGRHGEQPRRGAVARAVVRDDVHRRVRGVERRGDPAAREHGHPLAARVAAELAHECAGIGLRAARAAREQREEAEREVHAGRW